MTSRRIAKITQAIREQVSSSILFDIKDPRVDHVTVTRVEVSPDGQQARIYVSILADEKEQQLCMHGLRSARGFLQAKVAARIQTRYTPILSFEIDSGVKQSIEIAQIIRDTIDESTPSSSSPQSSSPQSPTPFTTEAATGEKTDSVDEGESASSP